MDASPSPQDAGKPARSSTEGGRSGFLRFLKVLGPGLVTGAADDDPSGIATYSQTGAQFGYGQLWTALYQIPLLLAVQEACARINKTAQADRTKRGMGTTFDCVLMVGNRAVIGHVGDSRVYLIRQGKVHRLTEDHTMLAMALKAGVGKKEDFADSDWANSLTRAVGPQPSVQVDTLLLDALGFPRDSFTAVFAMGRTGGWIAHAREQAMSGRLIRPKSHYIGPMPKVAA